MAERLLRRGSIENMQVFPDLEFLGDRWFCVRACLHALENPNSSVCGFIPTQEPVRLLPKHRASPMHPQTCPASTNTRPRANVFTLIHSQPSAVCLSVVDSSEASSRKEGAQTPRLTGINMCRTKPKQHKHTNTCIHVTFWALRLIL